MAKRRLVECGFYIPILQDKHLSDGQPHLAEAWAAAGRQPLRVRRRDTVGGGPPRQVAKLRPLLREACVVLAQQCIYLSVAGYVEFVEGPGNE